VQKIYILIQYWENVCLKGAPLLGSCLLQAPDLLLELQHKKSILHTVNIRKRGDFTPNIIEKELIYSEYKRNRVSSTVNKQRGLNYTANVIEKKLIVHQM
jgi:hypothetical protein